MLAFLVPRTKNASRFGPPGPKCTRTDFTVTPAVLSPTALYTDSYKNLVGKKFMCKIASVFFMALSQKILMFQ